MQDQQLAASPCLSQMRIHTCPPSTQLCSPLPSSLPWSNLLAELRRTFHLPHSQLTPVPSPPTGGELKEASELTSEPYLRRWLRARSWNVESAARSILAHAKWRVSMAPDGHVPKVG